MFMCTLVRNLVRNALQKSPPNGDWIQFFQAPAATNDNKFGFINI